MDAVKLIDAEIERCKERAIRSQATADNPPNERVDPVYWQKDATAAIRKVHRLSIVTEWLEAESNAR